MPGPTPAQVLGSCGHPPTRRLPVTATADRVTASGERKGAPRAFSLERPQEEEAANQGRQAGRHDATPRTCVPGGEGGASPPHPATGSAGGLPPALGTQLSPTSRTSGRPGLRTRAGAASRGRGRSPNARQVSPSPTAPQRAAAAVERRGEYRLLGSFGVRTSHGGWLVTRRWVPRGGAMAPLPAPLSTPRPPPPSLPPSLPELGPQLSASCAAPWWSCLRGR